MTPYALLHPIQHEFPEAVQSPAQPPAPVPDAEVRSAVLVAHVSARRGLPLNSVIIGKPLTDDVHMENQRARIYAVCAVKLDEDHTDAAEGTFDAALTNALVAIVAHEWTGEEKQQGKTYLKSARALLSLIERKAKGGDRAKPAPGESGVYLIPNTASDCKPPADISDEGSIFSSEWIQLPALDPWIDVATLIDALEITQPTRHGRPEEGHPLERRHVEALLALDNHESLMALSAEQEDRHERSAGEEDQREWGQALDRLKLLGQDEADRRAAVAAEIHDGYHPKHNPEGLDMQDCPVCDYPAFSSEGGDSLDMQIGIGQCLVCHYERSPAIAEAEAYQVFYEARLADD